MKNWHQEEEIAELHTQTTLLPNKNCIQYKMEILKFNESAKSVEPAPLLEPT